MIEADNLSITIRKWWSRLGKDSPIGQHSMWATTQMKMKMYLGYIAK